MGSPEPVYKDPVRLYQPVWCKGQVNDYYQFQRDCADRYEVVKELASRFNRPFSVLDVGSSYGYFDVRLMEDFPNAVCVLIDNKEVEPILKENLQMDRSVVIKRKVTAKELMALSRSESFDIVLGLSVLHHFDDPELAYKAIRRLGWWSVFEIPGVDDLGAAFPEKHEAIRDLFPAKPDGFFDSHVSESKRPYFILENVPFIEEQSLDAADRDAPGYSRYRLDVDYDRATFLKGGDKEWWLQCNRCGWKLESGAAAKNECPECGGGLNIHSLESRAFLPGMNLYNFIRLGGGWPTGQLIDLECEQYSGHPDFYPWNFIVGKGITPIDMERK